MLSMMVFGRKLLTRIATMVVSRPVAQVLSRQRRRLHLLLPRRLRQNGGHMLQMSLWLLKLALTKGPYIGRFLTRFAIMELTPARIIPSQVFKFVREAFSSTGFHPKPHALSYTLVISTLTLRRRKIVKLRWMLSHCMNLFLRVALPG